MDTNFIGYSSIYDQMVDGIINSADLGHGIASLSVNGKMPTMHLTSITTNYVGTSPSFPANYGDYYIDSNNQYHWWFDGSSWIQQSQSYADKYTAEHADTIYLNLIRRIIHLKQCGAITAEKAFNMQLMVLSEDPENYVLVREIIIKLENEMIDVNI